MRDVLVYGGKSFAEFNTFFDGSKSFGTPEKDYEIISIPGRSGDLSVFNNRYKDQTIDFPCFIRNNFLENYRALTEYLNSLNGYQRLETSKEPYHFRKALFLGLVEPQTGSFNKSGSFTISFRCNPQRWLKEGENWLTFESTSVSNPAKIFNPTLQPAKPLIRIHGTGLIMCNGVTFNLLGTGSYDYVDVDCETVDVYTVQNGALVNLNNKFNGVFPTLNVGENTLYTLTAGNVIEVMPRWFEI